MDLQLKKQAGTERLHVSVQIKRKPFKAGSELSAQVNLSAELAEDESELLIRIDPVKSDNC